MAKGMGAKPSQGRTHNAQASRDDQVERTSVQWAEWGMTTCEEDFA